jgi:hypothetical protein
VSWSEYFDGMENNLLESMISKRLKIIFFISIPVFIAHGLEEYVTEFYDIDSFTRFVFGLFEKMSVSQATFLLFQVMVWLLIIISAFLIADSQWQFRLMVIPGLVYIFELYHLVKSLSILSYYPGLITAFAFPFIGYYFWREYIRILKTKS